MRRTSLFWKLLALISVLALAVIVVLAAIASTAYRALVERELDDRLQSEAAALAVVFADRWPEKSDEKTQALVWRVGERAGVRLTLIAPDGRVLADSYSKLAAAGAPTENHGQRAEFVAAMRSGRGASQRLSPTVGERLWYRAVRVDVDGKPIGVVRTAFPAASMTAEVERINRWIWTVGLLAATVAVGVASVFATRWTAPLRELADSAEALASGLYDRKAPTPAGHHDEIGAVASALNDLGKQLAQRERQLRNTSQTQATVLEGMTESVIAVDRSEKILFANASAGRALGFDAKECEGLTLLGRR